MNIRHARLLSVLFSLCCLVLACHGQVGTCMFKEWEQLEPFDFEPQEPEEVRLLASFQTHQRPCKLLISIGFCDTRTESGMYGDLCHHVAPTAIDRWEVVVEEGETSLDWKPHAIISRDWEGFYTLLVEARWEHEGGERRTIFEVVRFNGSQSSGACEVKDEEEQEDEGSTVPDSWGSILHGRSPVVAESLRVLNESVTALLEQHQNRMEHLCNSARFVIWNSFGVHGFGSQLLSLRIGLEYGIRTNRVVVHNPEFEQMIVQDDLALRFGEKTNSSSSSSSSSFSSSPSPSPSSPPPSSTPSAPRIYWDNYYDHEGVLESISTCDRSVLNWLDPTFYAPLREHGENTSPVLEQYVEEDEALQHSNLLQLHPVTYGKKMRKGAVRPPAALVSDLVQMLGGGEEEGQTVGTNIGGRGGGESSEIRVGGGEEERNITWSPDMSSKGHVSFDVYWWHLLSTWYLFRPKASLMDHVNSVKESLGWNEKHKVIGVHIRMGKLADAKLDKVNEAQRIPVSLYVRETNRLARIINATAVFVCSDHPGAINKFIRMMPSNLQVFTQDSRRSSNPLMALMTDLILVSHTDAIVFTFTSTFGQIAMHLHARYTDFNPVFIAMDDYCTSLGWAGYHLELKHVCISNRSSIRIMVHDCEAGACDERMRSQPASGPVRSNSLRLVHGFRAKREHLPLGETIIRREEDSRASQGSSEEGESLGQSSRSTRLSEWRKRFSADSAIEEEDQGSVSSMSREEGGETVVSRKEGRSEKNRCVRPLSSLIPSFPRFKGACRAAEQLDGLHCLGLTVFQSSSEQQCKAMCCSYGPCALWQWIVKEEGGAAGDCWLGLGQLEYPCLPSPEGWKFKGEKVTRE